MDNLPVVFPSLPPRPARPLKGKGYARKPFPYRLTSPQAKRLWYALPVWHKAEISTWNGGKNFTWRRFISPEVSSLLIEFQKKF